MVWLRKILASQLTQQVRRYTSQRRNVHLERNLDADLDRSSQALQQHAATRGTTPSQHAIRREQDALLADALAELPPHYREVIVLRNLEGLSFPEVSEKMGRTINSVKNMALCVFCGY